MKLEKFISSALITALILIFSFCASTAAFAETIPSSGNSTVTTTTSETTTPTDDYYDSSVNGPIGLDNCSIKLEYPSVAYDGSEKTPAVVSVTTPDGKIIPADYYSVTYSNNINAGTASVTIFGNTEYSCYGSLTANFEILNSVTGLKQTDKTKSTISLRWDDFNQLTIGGYAIYIYSKKSGSWKAVKYVDYGTAETKLTGLSSATVYNIKVAVYTIDETTGEKIISCESAPQKMKTVAVAPPKVILKSATAKKPYVSLSWKNFASHTANKYQIKVSLYSNFYKSKIITLKNGKSVSKRVFGLINGKRYYFKVRAIKTFEGKSLKGDWSNTKSATATSTGWARISKRLYYFINGVSLKGTHTIGKETYYFGKDNGECHGVSYKVWQKVKNAKSKTKYAIAVSISKKRVNVFERVNGSWAMKYQWECTTGANNSNHPDGAFTPLGSFSVRKKLRWMDGEEKDYTVWYATGFIGRIFFHSVLYEFQNMELVRDPRLGIAASHGCIRLSLQNAKWIYDNIGFGTKVIVL